MSMDDDDEPLWKRILFNEIVLVAGSALAILSLAFWLATRGQP